MVAGAVLLGTACGSTTSPEPEPVSEEPAAASGEDPAPLPPEEPAAEEEPVDDPGSQVEMYGGPPLDELV